MAGHARFTALLDACVIHPVAVIDSLLSAAHLGLYAPKWTTRIEQEWMKSLEVRTGQPEGALLRRRDAIRDACPDWEVPEVAWAQLIPSLVLPDPNDVHVLAAAIAGHADCIVTGNLKDFPDDVLAPFGISRPFIPTSSSSRRWTWTRSACWAHSSASVNDSGGRNWGPKPLPMPWPGTAWSPLRKGCAMRWT